MNANPKILFCSREVGPWMDRDEDILSEHFPTRRVFLSNSCLLKFQWLKDLIWCDLVYLWFASYFATPVVLAAKLFGKKLIIVTGGYDVARADQIGHGTYSKGFLQKSFRSFLLRQADSILCVSEFNKKEAVTNAGLNAEVCHVIPLAVQGPPADFTPQRWEARKNQAVMIASATRGSYRTKGLDQLLILAKACPDVNFILIGSLDEFCQNLIQAEGLKNLTTTGFLEYQSRPFLEVLNQSKVALQLSSYESFGAAIIDAGLCGCEMLVFNSGALAEVVSDSGNLVPYGDITGLSHKLRGLLGQDHSNKGDITQKLIKKYAPKTREAALVSYIKHQVRT